MIIGKPDFDAVQVRIYGLMNSESVTGAYQFDVGPDGVGLVGDRRCGLRQRDRVERRSTHTLLSACEVRH